MANATPIWPQTVAPCRRSARLAALIAMLAIMGMSWPVLAAGIPATDVAAHLRQRIQASASSAHFTCRTEVICSPAVIPALYRQRAFRPLWIDDALQLASARKLATAIAGADTFGLNPDNYHLVAIGNLLTAIDRSATVVDTPAPGLLADLDLLLTDAFLMLGAHLGSGSIDPESLHTDWEVTASQLDLEKRLLIAARTGRISEQLTLLQPAHPGYRRLITALAQLRAARQAGGWPQVQADAILQAGDRSPQVARLRQRLMAGGDRSPTLSSRPLAFFGPGLRRAVIRFQQRHGLKPDGKVGPRTRAALNVPIEQRIAQVKANLERWRWLPADLGTRHILVNVAGYRLAAVDHGRQELTMRVVVGRPARQTPAFSTEMGYLVINPYWHVPTSIAVKDLLPQLRQNAGWLTDHHIRVFAGWRQDSPQLDPATIDWQAYGRHRFPFKLRQDPGPKNALGRIKFIFPNRFAVYLHDTPNRSLFDRLQRHFSSGCVRVEKPLDLANWILSGGRHRPVDLAGQIAQGKRRIVRVKRPVKIHLTYMTAWADEQGRMQYRRDIYHRDGKLLTALIKRHPSQWGQSVQAGLPAKPAAAGSRAPG